MLFTGEPHIRSAPQTPQTGPKPKLDPQFALPPVNPAQRDEQVIVEEDLGGVPQSQSHTRLRLLAESQGHTDDTPSDAALQSLQLGEQSSKQILCTTRTSVTPPVPATSLGSAEAPDPDCKRWIPQGSEGDAAFPGCPPHPLFRTEQLGVDRRLIVNRKRQLKMYRVWIQGKFRKL
jgi:hypothetical protein